MILAMWSGPRNLSTALMRSFEARGHTEVWDEPLYGYYLAQTGLEHPGRDAILAHCETDWARLAERLVQAPSAGKVLVYQKHMTQHVIDPLWQTPGALAWMASVSHAFLIREPAEVIASYARVREAPTIEDIGIERQARIFDHVCALGHGEPPVIDAADVRADPRGTLSLLCEALGLPFSGTMLTWEPGLRPTDGVWAAHWYGSVERSTGFAAPAATTSVDLPASLRALSERSQAAYARLFERRLRPSAASRPQSA